jgi:hypothetical protein
MSSIAMNHKTSTTLVTIAVTLAVIASTGSINIVLAAKDVNVHTYINQKEECKTARENSPISNLCIARFSNAITQSGRSSNTITESVPTTTPTTATHPTVLTLAIYPNPQVAGHVVTVSGLLINTIASSGVGAATITFTGLIWKLVTSPDGTFSTSFKATTPGRYTVQAHYAGAGIYGPSNSVKIILFVT